MEKYAGKLEENRRKTGKNGGKREEIHMQRRLALLLTGKFLSKGAESVDE